MKISQIFVLKCPLNSKSASIQVMAWHQTGDKPLPESMMVQFTDAHNNQTSMSYVNGYDNIT